MATKKEAEEWYRKQLKTLVSKKASEEYKKMERRAIKPGSFIMFSYLLPKTKPSLLPFWDKNPVDVILDIRGNDMMCLNLHYAPSKFRKSIIAYIIKLNKANIRADRRLTLDYQSIKEYIKRNKLDLLIHRYKINRITNLKYIKLSELKYVAEIPLEKFAFNGDMSEDELYRMIYSHAYRSKNQKNITRKRK